MIIMNIKMIITGMTFRACLTARLILRRHPLRVCGSPRPSLDTLVT